MIEYNSSQVGSTHTAKENPRIETTTFVACAKQWRKGRAKRISSVSAQRLLARMEHDANHGQSMIARGLAEYFHVVK